MNNNLKSSPLNLSALCRCLLVALACLGAGASQATTVSASTFAIGAVSEPTTGLFMGLQGGTQWFHQAAKTGAPDMLIYGSSSNNNSGAYALFSSKTDFTLNSLTLNWNGGQSPSQSGWLVFVNNNQIVATGDPGAKNGIASLAWAVGTEPGFSTSYTLKPIQGLTYDYVQIVYDRKSAAPNSVGVSTFDVTTAAAPSPIPEPSTYAMMLAGIAAVGFMSRRRKLGGEG